MFIKELSGHSGCQLLLIEENGHFIVRKISVENYNFRLQKQCIKQRKFLAKDVKTPKILANGSIKNAFYFDMEYIHGKTLAQYCPTISVKEISYLIKVLFNNLYITSKKDPLVNSIFQKKIQDLHLPTDINNGDNKTAFCLAKDLLTDFDFEYVYKSPCHGDLTLENIIVTPNKEIYLIDFLDSFYNSWIIDVAKILQDLELKWSYRNDQDNVARDIRLLVAKEALINEVLNLPDGYIIVETIYHVLLLNILRIYPYTHDKNTLNFLNNSTYKILEKINSIKKEVLV